MFDSREVGGGGGVFGAGGVPTNIDFAVARVTLRELSDLWSACIRSFASKRHGGEEPHVMAAYRTYWLRSSSSTVPVLQEPHPLSAADEPHQPSGGCSGA